MEEQVQARRARAAAASFVGLTVLLALAVPLSLDRVETNAKLHKAIMAVME